MKTEKVSVGIVFHNEQVHLEPCLQSLFSKGNIEHLHQVILVDNNSSDGSGKIANKWKKTYPERVVLIHSQQNLIGQARQMILSHCQTDLLLFTDADCLLPTDWINEFLRHFSLHPQSGGLCGPNRLPENHLWQKCINVWMSSSIGNGRSPQALTPKQPRQVDHLPTTNALFSISALKRTNGFSLSLMTGEDVQIGHQLKRLGYELWMYPTPIVINDCSTTFKEWLNRMFRFGKAQWTHSPQRSWIVFLSLPLTLVPALFFAGIAHFALGISLTMSQPLRVAFKTPAYGLLSLTFYGLGFGGGGLRRLKKLFSQVFSHLKS